MSIKANTSHVLDIKRSRNAQERLRSDHIDMMYILENANSEIESLQHENECLKEQIKELCKGLPIASQQTFDCGHESIILSLKEEISFLKGENMTLKTNKAMAEKTKKKSIQDNAAWYKEEREKEATEANRSNMRVEDLLSEFQRMVRECRMCSELQVKLGQSSDERVSMEAEVATSKEMTVSLQDELEKHKNLIVTLQGELKKSTDATTSLQYELNESKEVAVNLQEKLSQSIEVAATLRDELRKSNELELVLQDEVLKLKQNQRVHVQTIDARTQTHTPSKPLESKKSTTFMTPIDSEHDDNIFSGNDSSECESTECVDPHSNFEEGRRERNFAEYVSNKRSNQQSKAAVKKSHSYSVDSVGPTKVSREMSSGYINQKKKCT